MVMGFVRVVLSAQAKKQLVVAGSVSDLACSPELMLMILAQCQLKNSFWFSSLWINQNYVVQC